MSRSIPTTDLAMLEAFRPSSRKREYLVCYLPFTIEEYLCVRVQSPRRGTIRSARVVLFIELCISMVLFICVTLWFYYDQLCLESDKSGIFLAFLTEEFLYGITRLNLPYHPSAWLIFYTD